MYTDDINGNDNWRIIKTLRMDLSNLDLGSAFFNSLINVSALDALQNTMKSYMENKSEDDFRLSKLQQGCI